MNTKTKRNIRVIHSRWQGNCRIEGLRLFREQGNDMAIITEGDGEDPRALFWPGYESVELLIYNPATDEYFATGAAGQWQSRHCAASVTGAKYVLHEPSRTLMYLIPKNACSTQMGTVLHELGFRPAAGSPSRVWNGNAYSHCLNNEDYDADKFGKYTHLVVFRDPVERFVNLANYAWCINRGMFSPFTSSCKSKRQLLDTMHLLVRMNEANHPGRFEQHLEGQAWYYDHCPRIDTVVRVEDLTDYMKTVMNVEPYNCNVDGKYELTRDDLTEEDIARIRENWAGDFLLEDRFKELFWINPTK